MNLDVTLAQLETAQLVRQTGEADAAYMFKHALTQDAAYQSLLQKQRRAIHARVAQAYEQIYADRCLDEYAAILAQHYAEAGNDAQALLYAIHAGDVAARTYATAEAILFYTRALESAQRMRSKESTEQLTSLYLKRGRMFELESRHDVAVTNYEEMEKLAREQNAPSMELAALMAQATIHAIPSTQFDIARAKALCDQALTLARAIGDRPAQAKILWNLMLHDTRLDTHYSEGVIYGEQAIEIARSLGLTEQLAYLLNDISLLYIWEGKPERAKEANLEARKMWLALNNQPMLADNLSYSAMGHILLGENELAIPDALEAQQISQTIGNVWGETFSQSWVGEAYRELGQIDLAITAMSESVRLAASSFRAPLSFTRADLASLYGDLGQVARGIELAKLADIEGKKLAHVLAIYTAAQLAHLYILDKQFALAESLIRETYQQLTPSDRPTVFSMTIRLVDAEFGLAQNDFARTLNVCDVLLDFRHVQHLRQSLPIILWMKGVALHHQGKSAQALTCLTDARTVAEQSSSRWTLWRIFVALAKIEMENGNIEQARTLRSQARAIVEYIAAHTPEELRQSFLNLKDVRNVMEI